MNNETQSDTKDFNPTVTAFFDSPKWAVKALKGQEGVAFLSMEIDSNAIAALKTVKIGNRLLLKKSTKPNSKGGSTFFLEVIPPFTEQGKTATEQVEDGI